MEKNKNPMVRLFQPEVEELIKNKRWRVLKDVISTWHAADIADLFREIDVKDCRLLPQKLQSEVFSCLDSDIQEAILNRKQFLKALQMNT